MSIEIRNVGKRFGSFVALDNVNLEVPTGELVALLGPSGCGKTTLLRIIAGLERADSGNILFDGEDATTQHVRERQVGPADPEGDAGMVAAVAADLFGQEEGQKRL